MIICLKGKSLGKSTAMPCILVVVPLILAACTDTGGATGALDSGFAIACANSKVNHDLVGPLAAGGGPAAVAADTVAHNALVAKCGPLSPEYVPLLAPATLPAK